MIAKQKQKQKRIENEQRGRGKFFFSAQWPVARVQVRKPARARQATQSRALAKVRPTSAAKGGTKGHRVRVTCLFGSSASVARIGVAPQGGVTQ